MKPKDKKEKDELYTVTFKGSPKPAKASPVFTCPSCGNTKEFKLFFSGTMESLCDASGGTLVTISEEFSDGGSIDKVVCNNCGQEV